MASFMDFLTLSGKSSSFVKGFGVWGRNVFDSIADLKAIFASSICSMQSSGIGLQFTIVSW